MEERAKAANAVFKPDNDTEETTIVIQVCGEDYDRLRPTSFPPPPAPLA